MAPLNQLNQLNQLNKLDQLDQLNRFDQVRALRATATRKVGTMSPGTLRLYWCFHVGALLLLLALAGIAGRAVAQTSTPRSAAAASTVMLRSANPAVASLSAYVAGVRRESAGSVPAAGSLWSESGRFTRLSTDVRAMRPHDVIGVVVAENLAAETDGTVKNSRSSSASSQVSSLLGQLHAGNALQNLLNQSSTAGLNAQGQSATNSSLTTVFGGEVTDVLPNGMLVIEAARQVEFNQQQQTITLRGIVRPEDISQANEIRSTSIASLELEVKGKGIINDYTRRQNPLVRLLQRILIF